VQQLDLLAQPLQPPAGNVVTCQDACGFKDIAQGAHDRGTLALEGGREKLHHQPAIVTVDHQGGEAVTLGVDSPPGVGVYSLAARTTLQQASPPPGGVDHHLATLQQPEPDLGGGGTERLTEKAAALVLHRHDSRNIGAADHVAPEDPRVAVAPALGAAGRDGGDVDHCRLGVARRGRRGLIP
jgi:hypothetical protein